MSDEKKIFSMSLVSKTFHGANKSVIKDNSLSLIYELNKNNFNKGFKEFIKKALPLTIITGILYLIAFFILANSYDLYNAILKVIFIGLASLTFPHILLEYLVEKNEKRN